MDHSHLLARRRKKKGLPTYFVRVEVLTFSGSHTGRICTYAHKCVVETRCSSRKYYVKKGGSQYQDM